MSNDPIADRLHEDAAARRRALDLASFIVEAPAGAGKTELLTQRTLRLLAIVDAPEEVLALTFTNKAATEMRDRILGSLEAATRDAGELAPHKLETRKWALAVLARDRELGWNLLAHPGRLRVTTLDALCAGLARQMPFLSRFGAQPAVTDDAEAHYATAARRTLAMVEADTPDAAVVAAALAFMDNDAGRLERLLVSMLGRRDQWLQHAARVDGGVLRDEVEAGFAALVERELARAADLLDAAWQARLMPLARFAAANAPEALAPLLDWQQPLRPQSADLAAWRALAGLLLTADGSFRKALNKNVGFPAGKEFAEQKAAMAGLLAELAEVPGLEAALAGIGGLPAPVLSDSEWSTVEDFSRLLRLAAGQLWLAFQEAGEVDFIEIAARAGLALGDDEAPTDLAQALDYRIRHLLVDEFQDTSPGQVALIARLMRGWTPDDGRTLFVVGDPMQSIYRFRKADVGLFLNVRARGIGDLRLEHLRLYRNNRSHPAIVDWVNGAFPAIFPPADDPAAGAVCYAESTATKVAVADSGVVLHPVFERGDGAAAEAALTLELIRAARAADPQGRIAVLVRARRHLDGLVEAIRRQAPELRFQAVEIEGLAERQHIQDLLSLYRALSHRADRVHWLAILRAPWCGLTLADLHALAGNDRQRTVWQLINDEARLAALSADGRQRLQHLRTVVGLALAERDRQPPRRWLEGVWLMLGGPRCLEAPAALADVEAFFALVEQLAAAHRLDPETLAARVGELYAPADPLGDAVQMMTIHKAKGLEFETVIVPGLHRDTGNNDSPLLLWDEVLGADGRERLLVAPLRARGERADEPTVYDTLRRLENARAAHETERLLYVAATRAIRRLHLVGVAELSDKSDDGLRQPPSGSFLRLLWPVAGQAVFAAALAGDAPAEVVTAEDGSTFVSPLLRLAEPAIPAELARPPSRPAANRIDTADAATAATSEAAVGTLVHRCLELIVRQGLAAWPPERLPALVDGWRRWLRAQGLDAAQAEAGADEALSALQTTLISATGRWLLADHPGGGAEQAWTSRDGELTVKHVIDRVFIADGVRWIVDYKTVRATPEELPARAEDFRPQLERYAALFANDPLPLKLAVWFVLQGRLVELLPAS
ncbi:UvrD-helicase domain-containing protein [uncultured Azonexus sp.]|uniref:UvrD-helicase domain-containing protein n=1 Tax=uncultured Azonexus sp. TaxID=520307 RepID=UPI00263A23A0|nr:UvrD-helicase domain-containing protein [uncultured Azonexus sp.]